MESRAEQGLPLDAARAVGYGVGIWAAATAAVVLAGDRVFPRPGTGAAVPAVLGLSLVAAVAAAIATFDYLRRTGLSGAAAGLAFGATIAAVGLVLDGLVLLAGGLSWPNLDADRTRSLAAFLLLGYGALVLAPWWVATRRSRR